MVAFNYIQFFIKMNEAERFNSLLCQLFCLILRQRMALNSQASCLRFLGIRIKDVHHDFQDSTK